MFNFLGWHVFKVGSRKLGFHILSPTAVLLYKYQCMVAYIANIQSIVGFVVILPKSGVIHWPTHPYIIPCFTGQNVKGSFCDAAQFSFGYLTTCPQHASPGQLMGVFDTSVVVFVCSLNVATERDKSYPLKKICSC